MASLPFPLGALQKATYTPRKDLKTPPSLYLAWPGGDIHYTHSHADTYAQLIRVVNPQILEVEQ